MKAKINDYCNLKTGRDTSNPRSEVEITVPHLRLNLHAAEARKLAGMLAEAADAAEKFAAKLASTIDRAKREIVEDVLAGRVPCSVKSFAELHDHVDANGYGGAFEAADPNDTEFWNAVQDAADSWIKSGKMLADASKAEKDNEAIA